jgi:hypothetical protein
MTHQTNHDCSTFETTNSTTLNKSSLFSQVLFRKLEIVENPQSIFTKNS